MFWDLNIWSLNKQARSRTVSPDLEEGNCLSIGVDFEINWILGKLNWKYVFLNNHSCTYNIVLHSFRKVIVCSLFHILNSERIFNSTLAWRKVIWFKRLLLCWILLHKWSIVLIPGKLPTNIIPKLVALYIPPFICTMYNISKNRFLAVLFFHNNYQSTCSESECHYCWI